ncbi:MAG: MFS transporter [Deltaproteobacteria bacterium]|nr:MFS transporter [Deltaproteobacteria bacterium]
MSRTATAAPPTPLAAALRKTTWRLIPFMFLLYVVAYIDRVNVGFAQLQMKQALQFSDAVYGFGAGLFFVTYFFFELPSNLLLHRFGPRRWMARIMITWGALSTAMMFVRGEWSFYALRLALGVAEAGFFPGMILYLTYWFPPRERATAVARFMTAIGLSLVVGGPVSGVILDGLHGRWGWAGWQWLFLLEGLPSVVLGFVTFAFLPDRPADVRWLSDAEKAAIDEALRAAPAAEPQHDRHTLREALADGRVWLLATIYFAFAMGLYGLTLWVPQILKDVTGGSALRVGLLSAIPYGLASVVMVAWSRSTDRTGAYRRNLIVATLVAAVALGAAALLLDAGPTATLVALSVGVAGLFATFGPFWALPSAFLRGTAAAAGIAVINSCGNLGGFASPWLVGLVKKHTGSFRGGILLLAGALGVAALLLAVGLRRERAGAK